MPFDDPTLDMLEFFQDMREASPEAITWFFQIVSNSVVYMMIPFAVAAFLIWFRDRRAGDAVMVNVLTAVNLSRFVKNIVEQPRPWVADPSLEPADGTNHSGGYSFPSAHCTTAAAGWGAVASVFRMRTVTAAAAAVILLVAFSRLYLGVHTPLEVVTGMVLGILVLAVNSYLLSVSGRSDADFRRISYLYMAVFLPVCIITVLTEDADLGNALMGTGMFYGYFAGRHIERFHLPAGVCDCDNPHAILLSVIGFVPAGAAALLFPMMHGVLGSAAAGIFAGLWVALLYPLILSRYVRAG